MAERKLYADRAHAITQTWVGFLIVVVLAQIALKPIRLGLGTTEFVTVFTTTTTAILGFWILVGQYLFRKPPPQD